jgi:nucleotide-binding universal stress UspA family protein
MWSGASGPLVTEQVFALCWSFVQPRRDRRLDGPPEVRVVVTAGTTGPTLVEESRTAELLVVGHCRRGELASVLLGSVGLYCVLHAHSPVLAVRPPADTSDGTGAHTGS